MKKLIVIAISIFLSFILFVGVVWPRYQDFRASQRKVQVLETEFQTREEFWRKIRNITEKFKEYYKEPLSKIDFALPSDPILTDLFTWMERQAARTGLILKEVDFDIIVPVEDISNIQETRILLRVSGSYDSFQRFLSIIESSARLIKIENISFSVPEEGPFIFDIIMKVYSYL